MSDMTNKSQKLASAIYLITSFFADQEPLKWKLRSLSADLVSDNIKDKSQVVKEAIALFSLAKNAGLVSEANHDILTREFSKIEDELKKPLELSFPVERIVDEKVLSLPQKLEPIKDKIEEKLVLKEFGAVSVKKNSRQSIIIALLKRKKEIMIKDVTPLIGGCSEKTIQRELSAMVQSGVLKKAGEKRWSRYSLA